MNKKTRELLARKQKHIGAMRAMIDKADAEGRDLTDEEAQAYDAERKSLEACNAAIEREEALAEEERSGAAINIGNDDITGGENRALLDPKHGFSSFGEFAAAVRAGSMRNGAIDQRLELHAAAASTAASEGSGADGGFLIPPEFSQEIFTLSLADDALLPLADDVPVKGNGMVFPKDETTPWGTDGVRAYWQQEATQAVATKPKYGTSALRLHKLMALTPVTDELLADGVALGAYLPKLVARSIRWKTNEAILFGDGAGKPMGAFTGACAVVQAKDSGQAANTVTIGNITNMISRLPPGSFPRSFWLVANDALPSLFTMTLGNYPIYMAPNGGAKDSPYGRLMGRPIMVSQHASAFSSQGDVNLLDLGYYRTITKRGGIETATSMHLYFDADETAYRSIFRVDGQPKISKPIQQAKGSNTLSPFVQLAAR